MNYNSTDFAEILSLDIFNTELINLDNKEYYNYYNNIYENNNIIKYKNIQKIILKKYPINPKSLLNITKLNQNIDNRIFKLDILPKIDDSDFYKTKSQRNCWVCKLNISNERKKILHKYKIKKENRKYIISKCAQKSLVANSRQRIKGKFIKKKW